MHVRKIHSNVFDVFLGTGWSNWTRVKKTHYGLSVVGGYRLPRSLMKEVETTLARY
jgi:hypothetical protein